MSNGKDLSRFLSAQVGTYNEALAEIRSGKKRTHWMWFIFPQLAGLGHSATAKFYSVADLSEASDYLLHPVLGKRLLEITSSLLSLDTNDAYAIFGTPDDLKLRSCMTLFHAVSETGSVFGNVIDKFFNGLPDERTLEKLR